MQHYEKKCRKQGGDKKCIKIKNMLIKEYIKIRNILNMKYIKTFKNLKCFGYFVKV